MREIAADHVDCTVPMVVDGNDCADHMVDCDHRIELVAPCTAVLDLVDHTRVLDCSDPVACRTALGHTDSDYMAARVLEIWVHKTALVLIDIVGHTVPGQIDPPPQPGGRSTVCDPPDCNIPAFQSRSMNFLSAL